MPDFVDAEAKERSLPNSWRGERVDEVVQRFHNQLFGKVDRHAALAMTEERRFCNGSHATLLMTTIFCIPSLRGG